MSRPRLPLPRIAPSGLLILLALAVLALARGVLVAAQVAGAVLAALLAPMATRPARAPARIAARRRPIRG